MFGNKLFSLAYSFSWDAISSCFWAYSLWFFISCSNFNLI